MDSVARPLLEYQLHFSELMLVHCLMFENSVVHPYFLVSANPIYLLAYLVTDKHTVPITSIMKAHIRSSSLHMFPFSA